MRATTKEQETEILNSPATRGAVHKMLALNEHRDPVDAAGDAELVAAILRGRCDRILGLA